MSFGEGFKVSGIVPLMLGIAVIVFALLPGGTFYSGLPGHHGDSKKPIPRWWGRLWFIAGGSVLIYLGIIHWRA